MPGTKDGRGPEPRKGMPSPQLDHDAFRARYLEQFADPAFDAVRAELDRVADIAWDGYAKHRKAPITAKAGPEFEDPDYDLAVEWYAARQAIKAAEADHTDPLGPNRYLIINCSSRSEHRSEEHTSELQSH